MQNGSPYRQAGEAEPSTRDIEAAKEFRLRVEAWARGEAESTRQKAIMGASLVLALLFAYAILAKTQQSSAYKECVKVAGASRLSECRRLEP